MKKINILLVLFFINGCSNIKNNISNVYDDIFVKKEISCPLITSPMGTNEIIVSSELNDIKSYVGFRGIKKVCFLLDEEIEMNLKVNIRSVRKKFKNDDSLKLKISLVSVTNNDKEYDRDDLNLNFFLKSGSEIVERESDMSVIIPQGGKTYIGLLKN
tara:strand:+ start:112 stop:585 length:474 start_codon:yes stop_codon:yes gene_type:complete